MSKPIRALLLAAGLGTRLRPITLKKPKCLVEVNGEPIIEYWLRKLEILGTESVIVNTHYHYNQVELFLKKQNFRKIEVNSFYEKELLGTAGTLRSNKDFFKGALGLLIHADNYTHFNLLELIKAHRQRPNGSILTMLTFKSNQPKNCGIVQVNDKGIVIDFQEKVESPIGNRANGAIYAFDQEFLTLLENEFIHAKDFSTEIIPNLIGKIYTLHTKEEFIDIGTPYALAKAQKL